jgi:hypothetical protein
MFVLSLSLCQDRYVLTIVHATCCDPISSMSVERHNYNSTSQEN